MPAKGVELIAESGDRSEEEEGKEEEEKEERVSYHQLKSQNLRGNTPWLQNNVLSTQHPEDIYKRVSKRFHIAAECRAQYWVSQKYYQPGYSHRISPQWWNTLHPQQGVSVALTNVSSTKCSCSPPWTPHRTNKLSPSPGADLRFSQIWDMLHDGSRHRESEQCWLGRTQTNSLNLTAWYSMFYHVSSSLDPCLWRCPKSSCHHGTSMGKWL